MATTNIKSIGPIGGARLSQRLTTAYVAFDSNGDATVTAKELGLANIGGFSGGAWGGTDNAVATVYSKTEPDANGVASVDLLCTESDGGVDAALNKTFSLLFWEA